jgi:hypothetical protein
MAALFWVTGGTGNWNSASNWALTSGGVGGIAVPSSLDTARFDANSGAGVATLDISPDIQTLNCSGFTGTLAFETNTISLNSTGTIFTGATTMTVTGTPQIICTNSSATARTITPTAVTEANSISFRVTAGTGTFTMSSTTSIRNIDFTDGVNPTGYAGVLSFGATVLVYGSVKFSTGMTVSVSGSALTFAATSGTQSFTTNGVLFDRPVIQNSLGATLQLQDNLTMGSTRTFTLTAGTLDLVTRTLSSGLFNSNNSNTRAIAFGTGNITVVRDNATIWNTATSTNLTYTGTPTVNFTYAGASGTRTIAAGNTAGGSEAVAISFNIAAATDTVNLSIESHVKNLTFTNFTGTAGLDYIAWGNLTLSAGMIISGSNNGPIFSATTGTTAITTNAVTFDSALTFNGAGGTFAFQDALTQGSTRTFTIANGTVKLKAGATSTMGLFAANNANTKSLQSTTPGSQATISQASGTVTVADLTIRDSNAVGGASWTAYADYENTDAGNNDGWNFGLSPPYASYEPPIIIRSFTQPRRF